MAYWKYLQRLCGASGVLPASFTLTEGFDHIDQRPFTCGGFSDVYRATYKGQQMAVKTLKTTSMDNIEDVHKVSHLIFCAIAQPAYAISSAFCEGGRGMEVASARECPAVHWGYVDAITLFDGLALDGEWKYYDVS